MKIAVITPYKDASQRLAEALRAQAHQVVLVMGEPGQLAAVAEQHRPELLLVDGLDFGPAELAGVEQLSARHPDMAVVLICAAQSAEFLVQAMRAGVREVLPAPANAEAVLAAIARIESRLKGRATPQGAGKVLAFLPCKGGSGATFLATHLGLHLAEHASVLLIDLNLQFGDALSFVHRGKPASTLADLVSDMRRLDASFLSASAVQVGPNFQILAAPDEVSQAMEITPEHIDQILTLAVAHYDFVVLDLGRALDTLSIKALDRADRIFPVLVTSLPAIRHAKKLLGVFKSLGYPADKVELMVNRFEKRGDISVDEISRLLGVPTVRTVPNAFKEVNDAINEGVALAASRVSPVAKSLTDFAVSLLPPVEEVRSSLLDRLFRRA